MLYVKVRDCLNDWNYEKKLKKNIIFFRLTIPGSQLPQLAGGLDRGQGGGGEEAKNQSAHMADGCHCSISASLSVLIFPHNMMSENLR